MLLLDLQKLPYLSLAMTFLLRVLSESGNRQHNKRVQC